MRRSGGSMEGLGVPLIVLVIALLVMGLCYSCTDDDCQSRGGHTEMVYGGRGGWVCEGANR